MKMIYLLAHSKWSNKCNQRIGREDKVVVKKILRSLPPKIDLKVSSIEEEKDLDIFSMDEMYGSLTTYEISMGKNKSTNRESMFKASKIT